MKSFLSDRQRLPVKSLSLPVATEGLARAAGGTCSAVKATPGAPASGGQRSAPHVETVKQGDKVVRIIVTCACGERVEIDCLYPAGG